MMTSLQRKLATLEASERLRRHAWQAAIAGIALATGSISTETPWLAGAATIALLAAAVWGLKARLPSTPRR